jgi:hypothetical protein
MDDDDPEKRIAELERRLAERPRPAVPGPPRYRDAREQPGSSSADPRVPIRVPRIAERVWTVNASLPTAEFEELLHIVFP